MLPSLGDLYRAFWLAWQLARFELGAATVIEPTPQAAKRSLRVLPFTLLCLVASAWPYDPRIAQIYGVDALQFSLIIMLQSLTATLGFFLLVWQLCGRIGIRSRFAHYMAVQNWVSLPIMLVLVGQNAIVQAAHFSADQKTWVDISTYAVLIMMNWIITISTLQLRNLAAFTLCLLEVIFSYLVQFCFVLLLQLTLVPLSAPPASP